MTDIIYLVHRLPFPPDKGDKIRSFNLLQHLAKRFDVHMGCFVDNKEDFKYVEHVEGLCKSLCVRPLNPIRARLRSLKGFIIGDALTLPYYFDRSMKRWVDQTISHNNVLAFVGFSSPMAQYAQGLSSRGLRKIMDFVDIDSDKWRQYASRSKAPMKWVYSREARCLSIHERDVTHDFDAAVFVSEGETKMFSNQFPELDNKIFAACNGVSTDYFDPNLNFESPFSKSAKSIVFTGMMNYWPNEDAMRWFARKIFPAIRQSIPEAELWVVGASPTKDVLNLKSIAGVRVTGHVADVRPYLKHAALIAAPMRIARGVQNKVLEALAMEKKVVCTTHAAFGLHDIATAPIAIADSESRFEYLITRHLLGMSESDVGNEARAYVLKNYDWNQNLRVFDGLICPESSG